MSNKGKKVANEMLADSLKALMLNEKPFDKIKIKDITDRAGIIRPTFYNHFQDKYELLEWIFYNDIIAPSDVLIETGMVNEALHLILERIQSEKEFMKRAYRITGQNSFEKIVFDCCLKFSVNTIKQNGKPLEENHPIWLKPDNLAHFYANNIAFILKMWNEDEYKITVQEMMEAIDFLSNHTFSGIAFGGGQP